ncbi:putative ABC-type ATPase [Sphingomonas vulcanisoli]|uniref:ABC-type ATPase n=1 Tax=Sphingomonas vulcanisoli TaxID=1658060 RepID=A0ABX0TQ17_9SPHN|nr:putative ABC-type ATPase [Sphingomonas vulcanisoli]
MTPQLWVFAGPNGAGKTTIVDRYVSGRIPVVNPDAIARSFPGVGSEAERLLRAGRIAVAERSRLLGERRTFAIETTLTGHSELDLMRSAKTAGFKVTLVYIGLQSVGHSIGRVRVRVEEGGHNVPLPDLLRRFGRSLANLTIAADLADRVILIDNSAKRRRFLLSRENGRVKYSAAQLPAWVEPIR